MALLGQLFGTSGGNQQSGSGGSLMRMAVIGALAYHMIKNRGGLSNLFGFGGSTSPQSTTGAQADTSAETPPASSGIQSAGLGGLTGLLSQVSDGNAGGAISGGVQHLLDSFRQNGMGEKIESWISNSQNKSISPGEMEQGLGSDMVNWLTNETGMAKDELLAGLSRFLPEAVDKLTPKGKVPTAEEAQQHVSQQQMH
jgi:uncharacterized protein YidB (DUF937 family)